MSEFFPDEETFNYGYEDGITNRQRRALRGPSTRERLNMARSAQAASGSNIRIFRQVKNLAAFKSAERAWHDPVRDGIAKRRLGYYALTVFDTKQQPLQYGEERSEASLHELFTTKYPALFRELPPIQVTGTDLFGNKECPYIGLTFEHGDLQADKAAVRKLVAPELWLDDSHQLEHRPHVTLGQVFVARRATEIQDILAPTLPDYVQFGPASIAVKSDQS